LRQSTESGTSACPAWIPRVVDASPSIGAGRTNFSQHGRWTEYPVRRSAPESRATSGSRRLCPRSGEAHGTRREAVEAVDPTEGGL
jgi:hypothetical protein